LDGHFVAAVGEGSGAGDFADVAGEVAVLDVDAAGLADGEGAAEQKGDAGEGEVAGLDVVDFAGAGAVEDGEEGLALDGFAVVFASFAAVEGDGRRRAGLR